MQCICAFLLSVGLSFGQENQETALTNYEYSFEIEFVTEQADEAMVKDIQSYSKDLFEVHPKFTQGIFNVSTSFPVPADRVTQHLGLYGFNVVAIRIEKEGKVVTQETSEQ